jgi:hypothetical protein
MKNDVIEIPIPKGHSASFDERTGKITFTKKPQNVLERIKTIDDILADHGIDKRSFELQCDDLEEDEKAYRILKLLVKSLNEGWTPNWDDDSQYKYVPWFYMGGSSGFRYGGYGDWLSSANVGSRLCFKSRELAEYAAKQFTETYKKYML